MSNLVFIPAAFIGLLAGMLLTLILWAFIPAGMWMLALPVACPVLWCGILALAMR